MKACVTIVLFSLFAGISCAQHHECDPFQSVKLLAEDGESFDYFGYSVSASENRLLVGAPFDKNDGEQAGSASIYVQVKDGWSLESKLIANDTLDGDRFGFSVSISDNLAAIGCPEHLVGDTRSGAVYVFRFDGLKWSQESKLVPPQGDDDDYFGASVAVGVDTIVVGANNDDDRGTDSGAAYVYSLNDNAWVLEAKLLAFDGVANDQFARSVSISNNNILIGALHDSDNGSLSGSAYVFRDIGSGWVHETKLLAEDGSTGDRFGAAVSISHNLAVIGAHNDADQLPSSTGSAYIFKHQNGVWVQEIKLFPNPTIFGGSFGRAVSIAGPKVVVSSHNAGNGAAFFFHYANGIWTQSPVLLPSDRPLAPNFGYSVAISDYSVFMGAPYDRDLGSLAGATYIFNTHCAPTCLADTNGDGVLSPADFSAWVAAFNAMAPECDQNADGSCSPADFSAWVANFNAGC